MSRPHYIMRADAGGSPGPTVATPTKMSLPIRQRLLTLTCLKSTAKTVLIEVCELAENGGRGACFASNATLAAGLGISKATVVRQVEALEAGGLLSSRVVKAEGNRRYLRPTPLLRACYAGGSEAAQLLAASNLTIVKNEAPEESDYSQNGSDYSQNREVTIVKTESDYSQNASRVIGDDQLDDHRTTKDDHLVRGLREALAEVEEELSAAQKKIVALEADLEAAHKASRTRGAAGWGGYDPAAIAENLLLPFNTDSFRQMWAAYRQFREESGQHRLSGGIQEQEALRHLGNLAAGSEAAALEILQYTIRGGYKSICKPHAVRTSTPAAPGVSGAGAKPTVSAADLAEATTRRRFQRDSGRADVQVQGAYAGQSPTGSAGLGPN